MCGAPWRPFSGSGNCPMSRVDDEVERNILTPARTFTLVGHEAARAQVLGALAQGRTHHAWLFSGPMGVGKATLAWHLARLLLAFPGETIADAPPHGLDSEHPVSRRLAAQTHPDCFLLRRARGKGGTLNSGILVEDVRALGRFLFMKGVEGGRRVVIIDVAEDMNRSAANALLKVLEEPPADTFFFLLSHAPGKLLPTIRSRCLHLPLQPLTEEEVWRVLETHELDETPEQRTKRALALCGGRPGRALALARSEAVEHLDAILPLLDGPNMLRLREKLAQVAMALAPVKSRGDFLLFMELLGEWLHDQARVAALSGEVARAAMLARLHSDMAAELAAQETYNLDRRQVLEGIVLRIAQAMHSTPPRRVS